MTSRDTVPFYSDDNVLFISAHEQAGHSDGSESSSGSLDSTLTEETTSSVLNNSTQESVSKVCLNSGSERGSGSVASSVNQQQRYRCVLESDGEIFKNVNNNVKSESREYISQSAGNLNEGRELPPHSNARQRLDRNQRRFGTDRRRRTSHGSGDKSDKSDTRHSTPASSSSLKGVRSARASKSCTKECDILGSSHVLATGSYHLCAYRDSLYRSIIDTDFSLDFESDDGEFDHPINGYDDDENRDDDDDDDDDDDAVVDSDNDSDDDDPLRNNIIIDRAHLIQDETVRHLVQVGVRNSRRCSVTSTAGSSHARAALGNAINATSLARTATVNAIATLSATSGAGVNQREESIIPVRSSTPLSTESGAAGRAVELNSQKESFGGDGDSVVDSDISQTDSISIHLGDLSDRSDVFDACDEVTRRPISEDSDLVMGDRSVPDALVESLSTVFTRNILSPPHNGKDNNTSLSNAQSRSSINPLSPVQNDEVNTESLSTVTTNYNTVSQSLPRNIEDRDSEVKGTHDASNGEIKSEITTKNETAHAITPNSPLTEESGSETDFNSEECAEVEQSGSMHNNEDNEFDDIVDEFSNVPIHHHIPIVAGSAIDTNCSGKSSDIHNNTTSDQEVKVAVREASSQESVEIITYHATVTRDKVCDVEYERRDHNDVYLHGTRLDVMDDLKTVDPYFHSSVAAATMSEGIPMASSPEQLTLEVMNDAKNKSSWIGAQREEVGMTIDEPDLTPSNMKYCDMDSYSHQRNGELEASPLEIHKQGKERVGETRDKGIKHQAEIHHLGSHQHIQNGILMRVNSQRSHNATSYESGSMYESEYIRNEVKETHPQIDDVKNLNIENCYDVDKSSAPKEPNASCQGVTNTTVDSDTSPNQAGPLSKTSEFFSLLLSMKDDQDEPIEETGANGDDCERQCSPNADMTSFEFDQPRFPRGVDDQQGWDLHQSLSLDLAGMKLKRKKLANKHKKSKGRKLLQKKTHSSPSLMRKGKASATKVNHDVETSPPAISSRQAAQPPWRERDFSIEYILARKMSEKVVNKKPEQQRIPESLTNDASHYKKMTDMELQMQHIDTMIKYLEPNSDVKIYGSTALSSDVSNTLPEDAGEDGEGATQVAEDDAKTIHESTQFNDDNLIESTTDNYYSDGTKPSVRIPRVKRSAPSILDESRLHLLEADPSDCWKKFSTWDHAHHDNHRDSLYRRTPPHIEMARSDLDFRENSKASLSKYPVGKRTETGHVSDDAQDLEMTYLDLLQGKSSYLASKGLRLGSSLKIEGVLTSEDMKSYSESSIVRKKSGLKEPGSKMRRSATSNRFVEIQRQTVPKPAFDSGGKKAVRFVLPGQGSSDGSNQTSSHDKRNQQDNTTNEEREYWFSTVNAMLVRAEKAKMLEKDAAHRADDHRFPRSNSAQVVDPINQKGAKFLSQILEQDKEEQRQRKAHAHTKAKKKTEHRIKQKFPPKSLKPFLYYNFSDSVTEENPRFSGLPDIKMGSTVVSAPTSAGILKIRTSASQTAQKRAIVTHHRMFNDCQIPATGIEGSNDITNTHQSQLSVIPAIGSSIGRNSSSNASTSHTGGRNTSKMTASANINDNKTISNSSIDISTSSSSRSNNIGRRMIPNFPPRPFDKVKPGTRHRSSNVSMPANASSASCSVPIVTHPDDAAMSGKSQEQRASDHDNINMHLDRYSDVFEYYRPTNKFMARNNTAYVGIEYNTNCNASCQYFSDNENDNDDDEDNDDGDDERDNSITEISYDVIEGNSLCKSCRRRSSANDDDHEEEEEEEEDSDDDDDSDDGDDVDGHIDTKKTKVDVIESSVTETEDNTNSNACCQSLSDDDYDNDDDDNNDDDVDDDDNNDDDDDCDDDDGDDDDNNNNDGEYDDDDHDGDDIRNMDGNNYRDDEDKDDDDGNGKLNKTDDHGKNSDDEGGCGSSFDQITIKDIIEGIDVNKEEDNSDNIASIQRQCDAQACDREDNDDINSECADKHVINHADDDDDDDDDISKCIYPRVAPIAKDKNNPIEKSPSLEEEWENPILYLKYGLADDPDALSIGCCYDGEIKGFQLQDEQMRSRNYNLQQLEKRSELDKREAFPEYIESKNNSQNYHTPEPSQQDVISNLDDNDSNEAMSSSSGSFSEGEGYELEIGERISATHIMTSASHKTEHTSYYSKMMERRIDICHLSELRSDNKFLTNEEACLNDYDGHHSDITTTAESDQGYNDAAMQTERYKSISEMAKIRSDNQYSFRHFNAMLVGRSIGRKAGNSEEDDDELTSVMHANKVDGSSDAQQSLECTSENAKTEEIEADPIKPFDYSPSSNGCRDWSSKPPLVPTPPGRSSSQTSPRVPSKRLLLRQKGKPSRSTLRSKPRNPRSPSNIATASKQPVVSPKSKQSVFDVQSKQSVSPADVSQPQTQPQSLLSNNGTIAPSTSLEVVNLDSKDSVSFNDESSNAKEPLVNSMSYTLIKRAESLGTGSNTDVPKSASHPDTWEDNDSLVRQVGTNSSCTDLKTIAAMEKKDSGTSVKSSPWNKPCKPSGLNSRPKSSPSNTTPFWDKPKPKPKSTFNPVKRRESITSIQQSRSQTQAESKMFCRREYLQMLREVDLYPFIAKSEERIANVLKAVKRSTHFLPVVIIQSLQPACVEGRMYRLHFCTDSNNFHHSSDDSASTKGSEHADNIMVFQEAASDDDPYTMKSLYAAVNFPKGLYSTEMLEIGTSPYNSSVRKTSSLNDAQRAKSNQKIHPMRFIRHHATSLNSLPKGKPLYIAAPWSDDQSSATSYLDLLVQSLGDDVVGYFKKMLNWTVKIFNDRVMLKPPTKTYPSHVSARLSRFERKDGDKPTTGGTAATTTSSTTLAATSMSYTATAKTATVKAVTERTLLHPTVIKGVMRDTTVKKKTCGSESDVNIVCYSCGACMSKSTLPIEKDDLHSKSKIHTNQDNTLCNSCSSSSSSSSNSNVASCASDAVLYTCSDYTSAKEISEMVNTLRAVSPTNDGNATAKCASSCSLEFESVSVYHSQSDGSDKAPTECESVASLSHRIKSPTAEDSNVKISPVKLNPVRRQCSYERPTLGSIRRSSRGTSASTEKSLGPWNTLSSRSMTRYRNPPSLSRNNRSTPSINQASVAQTSSDKRPVAETVTMPPKSADVGAGSSQIQMARNDDNFGDDDNDDDDENAYRMSHWNTNKVMGWIGQPVIPPPPPRKIKRKVVTAEGGKRITGGGVGGGERFKTLKKSKTMRNRRKTTSPVPPTKAEMVEHLREAGILSKSIARTDFTAKMPTLLYNSRKKRNQSLSSGASSETSISSGFSSVAGSSTSSLTVSSSGSGDSSHDPWNRKHLRNRWRYSDPATLRATTIGLMSISESPVASAARLVRLKEAESRRASQEEMEERRQIEFMRRLRSQEIDDIIVTQQPKATISERNAKNSSSQSQHLSNMEQGDFVNQLKHYEKTSSDLEDISSTSAQVNKYEFDFCPEVPLIKELWDEQIFPKTNFWTRKKERGKSLPTLRAVGNFMHL